ncbi:glutathionine S-transferase [Legionella wadsworthii]|uniref:Glutathionine S-transferase n=2 Tax=Legionella wadsworthii TaxID=28088 RepID=A0A378LMK5_9GAMM|nr:glutathionine S-transferase [Legionella wadsworthii]
MALAYCKIKVEQREVDLKNKPQEMLLASPKGTVPVLILNNGHVIDESIEIMKWALAQSDPEGWFSAHIKEACQNIVSLNDFEFKPLLDGYKYPQKSAKEPLYYRNQAREYLEILESLLRKHRFLFADNISMADVALFPFIRQFYMVDPNWFEDSEYKFLKEWVAFFLNSELFLSVMKKSS